MCQITGKVPDPGIDSQGFGPPDNQVFMAPNRYGPIRESGDYQRSIHLVRPMHVVRNGVRQYVPPNSEDKTPSNNWPRTKEEADADTKQLVEARRHYPNVDLHKCPVCGAEVAVEG
jgi:hypothetical protein